MKTLYVYSTLASDVLYQNTAPSGNDLPRVTSEVLVRGGAGVMNDRLVTPRGVATQVTEEQVEALRANKVFQMHEENGFVSISEHRVDADEAAADLTGRDVSAPLVPNDLGAGDQPSVGAESKDDDAPAPAPASRRRR